MGIKRVTGFLMAGTLALAVPAAGANGNGLIAYESGGSIYTIDAAGGTSVLLHGGYRPTYSPDGTRMAYAADGIWVSDADGSKPVRIAPDGPLGALTWSSDGTRLAYISRSSSGAAVSIARTDGSGTTVVAQGATSDAPPTWSPDGTELAFTTTNDTDIAVVNADGSGRRLLIQDSTNDLAPSWSPDGSHIAFYRGSYGSDVLYTVKPDGSGLRQLGQAQVDPNSQPAWSPDSSTLVVGGRQLVGYTKVGPAYRYDVYAVTADGTGERRLTENRWGNGFSPRFSPDGRRILFLSGRPWSGSARQVFAMNPDGSCQTQLTSAVTSVSAATWQARGTVPPADPLHCAALALYGTLDASTDHPALDDDRVYVYHGDITNYGDLTSDALRLTTSSDNGPFSYVSASVTGGACAVGADLSCTVPPLAPGATANVEIRFDAFVAGDYRFELSVAGIGSTPDGDLSDNVDYHYRRFPFCEISTQNGSTIRATGVDDLICGTLGRDSIVAGGGHDKVLGGPGHDTVHAGPGRDQVDGGEGTDYVYGERGADRLHGGYGDDVLIGGDGKDVLWGDVGGDFLKGGSGEDRFFGGYGNDLIDSRDELTEHVYCGEGKDTVQADWRDIVSPDCEKVIRRSVLPGV